MTDPTCQPPWNYDLMGAGYWISLGISMLLILGAALTLARLIGQFRAEWFLVLGLVLAFGLGLFWNTLEAPYYCSVKAFYALPVLLPFSALAAVGWDWLRQRHRAVSTVVWVLLLIWSMTVYTSFWVRSGNPATQLVRAIALGAALKHQGKLDEAISQYQEVIRLKPDYALAYNSLGYTLGKKGQIDEAIGQFQEAIRLKSDYAEAHYNLGTALYLKGRNDEAIRQFQEAVRLKPDYIDAHYNLGIALSKQGQTDEAIRQFQEVIRLKPDYPDAHDNLARALEMKNAPTGR